MTGPPDGLVTDPANRPPNLPEGNALFAVASRQGRAGSLPAVMHLDAHRLARAAVDKVESAPLET